jgi:hypothetical protein
VSNSGETAARVVDTGDARMVSEAGKQVDEDRRDEGTSWVWSTHSIVSWRGRKTRLERRWRRVCFGSGHRSRSSALKRKRGASQGALEEWKEDSRRRRGSCSPTASESCEEARRSAGVRREILSHRVNNLEREQTEKREEGLGYL